MNVITAIVPDTRRPGRFDILVDGQRIATLSLESIERLQIVIGASVSGLEDRIADEAAQLTVYDRAIAMLAFRARASRELSRALVRKGALPEHADRAIALLQHRGLLDDNAFARSFTRAKVLGASQSRRRVQQELTRKGVARDVASEAIDTVFREEEVDQRMIVEVSARKKLRLLARHDPVVRRRRLYAFLARRGYDADDIRHAMTAVGVELQDEPAAGASGHEQSEADRTDPDDVA